MSGAGRLRLALAIFIVGATAVIGAPGSGAGVAGVSVSDTDFAPATIKVRVDEPVVFALTRDSQYDHTVTSDDGSFPEEVLDGSQTTVKLRFPKAGRYAYYCKYDGRKGGGGMSGVIVVAADQATTTTTTEPPTTSTTAAAPTTTTEPTTTTTTEPAPIHAFDVPAAPPPDPATTVSTKAPKPAPTTTTTAPKVKPVTTDTIPTTTAVAPRPDLPSLSSLLAPDPTPPATSADTTPTTGRATPDSLALQLSDSEGKPADETGLLIAVGVLLIVVTAAGTGYAWHHRSSRYFSA